MQAKPLGLLRATQSSKFILLLETVGLCKEHLSPERKAQEVYCRSVHSRASKKMVLISFEDIEKISNFCFMHKCMAQKLSLPHPFEV